jgi:hypothetical protein
MCQCPPAVISHAMAVTAVDGCSLTEQLPLLAERVPLTPLRGLFKNP